MTRMVQVAVAGDVTEAEELQTILRSAGIDAELEFAVDHDPLGTEDAPQKVMVPEDSLEAAQHAIEALTEPEEIVDEAHFGRVARRYDELRPADENWWELFELLVREGDLVGRRVLDIGCEPVGPRPRWPSVDPVSGASSPSRRWPHGRENG